MSTVVVVDGSVDVSVTDAEPVELLPIESDIGGSPVAQAAEITAKAQGRARKRGLAIVIILWSAAVEGPRLC